MTDEDCPMCTNETRGAELQKGADDAASFLEEMLMGPHQQEAIRSVPKAMIIASGLGAGMIREILERDRRFMEQAVLVVDIEMSKVDIEARLAEHGVIVIDSMGPLRAEELQSVMVKQEIVPELSPYAHTPKRRDHPTSPFGSRRAQLKRRGQ